MRTDPSRAWEGIIDPDERILWQGKPVSRLVFRPSDLVISAFGVFFFCFAVFWMTMAGWISSGTGPMGYIFPLFGIPFVLVGAYMLFGKYFWDAYRRRRTWYTLTDRRAFIATDIIGNRTLKDYRIEPDSDITLLEEGGEQTIWFAEVVKRGQKGATYTEPVGFELLADGREVYSVMQDVRRQLRNAQVGEFA
jgi:hypothetical protein